MIDLTNSLTTHRHTHTRARRHRMVFSVSRYIEWLVSFVKSPNGIDMETQREGEIVVAHGDVNVDSSETMTKHNIWPFSLYSLTSATFDNNNSACRPYTTHSVVGHGNLTALYYVYIFVNHVMTTAFIL